MIKKRKPCHLTPLKRRHQRTKRQGMTARHTWAPHQAKGECRRRLLQIAHGRLMDEKGSFIPPSTIAAAFKLRRQEAGLV